MIHIMKLQPRYFNYIKNGTKEYEIRLNDEKRRNIKKGDFIEFQKEPLFEEKLIIKVDDLIYYDNFNELLNNINIKLLSDQSMTKEELNSDLEKIYPIKNQKKYGVVVIKLNKKNNINSSNINVISSNNKIFNIIRNNYIDFDTWLDKMKKNNVNVYYTGTLNDITSIMILKINENDSQQFFENGKILKIRTFFVNDNKKGIGKMYLDLVNKIAIDNDINYIYLTIKNDNIKLINYIERNGYSKYNEYNNEHVYYKEIK